MNTNQGMKVTFNGIDLSKWIEVSDVQRNIGQNRKATLIKVGTSNGKRFISTSADEGTIVVKGDVMYQLVSQRRDLAAALATDEPMQLIFDDEPDKYYMAICDQQTTMSEEQFLGEAVITFVVPDDLAHSVTTSTVSGSSGADILINNDGSAPTAPVITAAMKSDNGLVALVNNQGATLQFGSVDERDNVAAKKSDPTLHLDYGYLEGDAETPEGVTINTGVDLYPNFLGNASTPNERAGSVKFGVKTSDGMVSAVPQFTGTAKDVWTGPSMHVDVTPNSDNLATGNFIFEQQFHFDSTTRTSGRIEFVLEHGSDVAFSFVMRSSTSLSDEVVVEIGAGNPGAKGTMFISYTLDRKKFTNGYYQLIISRVSGVITYKLSKVLREIVDVVSQTGAQLIRTFDFSTLSSAAVWPITGITTQWRRWPGPDAPCTMDLADTRFTWVNVDYLQDIPNRFSDGDVVTVDVANKRILVNGVEDMTLHTIGNMWDGFKLKPGANTIQVIASSWCATPLDVNVSYREAWY